MKPPRTVLVRALAARHFLIAAGILLVATAAWEGTLKALGQVLSKKPVPLLRSLEQMSEFFGSRFVLARELHEPSDDLDHGKVRVPLDVEEMLGTKDHITWLYKDTRMSAGGALAYVRLHIAYYPRVADNIPHVSDVCMLAAGHDVDGDSPPTLLSWQTDGLPGPWQRWRGTPMQRTAFVKRERGGGIARSVVFHVFSVNGNPLTHRLDVGRTLADPRKTYCYYAKIELGAGRLGHTLSAAEAEEMCRSFWSASAGTILTRHMPSAQDVEKLESSQ